MAVLCGMPTIHYLARSGPLFVHRCPVSRSCEWVMSALCRVTYF